MDGDRIRQALARIDHAARRIEDAAVRPPAASAAGDQELERRHASLCTEVGAALRELDGLIESLEQ